MNTAQIVLLVIGIIAFVASFLVAEKKEAADGEMEKQLEAKLQKSLEGELENAKSQIQDAVEETIQYSVEKTERAMERVTNEKIMAVSEYADTVLGDINKNHTEVLFLYDMLNDKHENLKTTAMEVEKTAKEAVQSVKDVKEVTVEETVLPEQITELEQEEKKVSRTTQEKKNTESFQTLTVEQLEKEKAPKKRASRKATPKKTEAQMFPDVDIKFQNSSDGKNNSNDKIIELHNAGKSNMAIAKELGLGIGEVKLVIDLFESIQ